MNILIVEDNQALRDALQEHLLQAGHILEVAGSLAEAKSFWQLKSDDFDLVVLDLNLPDGLGSELLRTIDQSNARTGVLVLTARADLTDVVDLLDQGADDYLTKPFQFPELDARIRAIHRRRSQRSAGTQYWFGLEFDELAGIFGTRVSSSICVKKNGNCSRRSSSHPVHTGKLNESTLSIR